MKLKQTKPMMTVITALLSLFYCSISTATPMPIPNANKLNIPAKAWVLMASSTNKVLAQHNAHHRYPPASLTKMMTSYVVSQAIAHKTVHLSDKVRISHKAWKTPGSKMFIRQGNQVSVENLLKGLIIQSGNDAAVALAEHTAGNEAAFVQMMNHSAKQLNLKNTHFDNASGLPAKNQYTTAYDMALLSKALIHDYPQEYRWYKQKHFTWNNIKQHNRNKLLHRNPHVDGLKTGYTKAAQYCLTASAVKQHMRLIVVIMGAKDAEARSQAAQQLFTYGFRFYQTHILYHANTAIKTIPVIYGKQDEVSAGTPKQVLLTLPKGQYQQLKLVAHIQHPLEAPIKKAQSVGYIDVQLNGKTLKTVPLVSLHSVAKANIAKRSWDWVKSFF